MDNEVLVKSIRNMCKEYGITVSQLEKELNFGAGLISRWAKADPSLSKIVDIADYFNVTIDKLIGRELKTQNIIDTQFVEQLYEMTKSEQLQWKDYSDKINELIYKKDVPIEDDGYQSAELFTAKYKKGFFILYTQYDKEKGVLEDIFVQLYIQPGKEEKLVLQDCDETQLNNLWLYIHTKFYGTLDEIKAEEFKNSFINNSFNVTENIPLDDLEDNFDTLDKMINNPQIMQVMKTVNSKEFQKVQEIFSSSDFQATMKMVNRFQGYYNKIIEATNKRAGD